MWLAIIVIVAAIVIGVAIGLKQRQANNKLLEEGRMIKRDISFVETAEVFTLSGADFERVVNAIWQADFSGAGVSIEKDSAKQAVMFKAKGWAAQLYRMEDDNGKYSYCFTFTAWQTYRGIPQDHAQMNQLLTAVEKAFLSIDPNTQVQASKIKTKTKTSFL